MSICHLKTIPKPSFYDTLKKKKKMYRLFQEICGLKNLRLKNYIMLFYVCELLHSLVQILVLKSNS